MSTNPKREHFIKAILSNEKLTEEEKSEIISDMMDEFRSNYPNLEHHATKQDVTETELKLTKEIENTRKEIKELDVKLTREMKELDLKLTKEIENTRKEIKELDLKLTKEIKELDVKLTKEIKNLDLKLSKEIKEVEVRLTEKIEKIRNDTLKWTFMFWVSQMLAIGSILYKVFS